MVALGGLVFASLQPLREQTRFRTARDRIDAVVREARELAMRSGEPVVLAFDPVTGRLSVTGLEPDGAAERGERGGAVATGDRPAAGPAAPAHRPASVG